jgi:hypothetical protein
MGWGHKAQETLLWGTVMIYCGSGCDSGKVSVPVPDPKLFSTAFQQHIFFIQNLAFSIIGAAFFH